MVATRDGMSICFNENDARAIGRTARGVRAITLGEGDEVVGMVIFGTEGKVLTISEKGYGRRSDVSNYRVQNRGGKGLTNYHTEQYGKVCAIEMVDETQDIIMISSDGIIIRLPAEQVRECNRPSKGVILMKTKDGEKVATISLAQHEDVEEETEATEVSEAEVVTVEE
jgi:DNA gyrase subunit A